MVVVNSRPRVWGSAVCWEQRACSLRLCPQKGDRRPTWRPLHAVLRHSRTSASVSCWFPLLQRTPARPDLHSDAWRSCQFPRSVCPDCHMSTPPVRCVRRLSRVHSPSQVCPLAVTCVSAGCHVSTPPVRCIHWLSHVHSPSQVCLLAVMCVRWLSRVCPPAVTCPIPPVRYLSTSCHMCVSVGCHVSTPPVSCVSAGCHMCVRWLSRIQFPQSGVCSLAVTCVHWLSRP